MKLIKDLGMKYPTKNSKVKHRYGLYECKECFKHEEKITNNVRKGNIEYCADCALINRSGNKSRKDLNINLSRMSNHKLYDTWSTMLYRCDNDSKNGYKDRGIKVSDEFRNISIWLKYVESLDNAYKEYYSIDRINNNKNYERGNLRWASKSTQTRNTRRLYAHNTSGYRCVTLQPNGRWRARLKINGSCVSVGSYDYPWTAAYAYDSYVINNNLEHTKNFC